MVLGTPVVLDLDPRSDATRGVGIQPGGNRYERLFAGALNGIATESLAQMEVHTEEGFAIIPGSPETAFLEARQFSVAGADDAARRRAGACAPCTNGASQSSTLRQASIGHSLEAQSARLTS